MKSHFLFSACLFPALGELSFEYSLVVPVEMLVQQLYLQCLDYG